MLQKVIDMRPAADAICQLQSWLANDRLSAKEWKLLIKLREILPIFVQATTRLSAIKYLTLSAQLPYDIHLSNKLEDAYDELHEEESQRKLCHAVDAAWNKLNEYYSLTGFAQVRFPVFYHLMVFNYVGMNDLQASATILDPRCKITAFHSLRWRQDWINKAGNQIPSIYNRQYAPAPTAAAPSPSTGILINKDDHFSTIYSSRNAQGFQLLPPSHQQLELEQYLEEPLEWRTMHPMDWWRTYASWYSDLACMTCDYHAIPATMSPLSTSSQLPDKSWLNSIAASPPRWWIYSCVPRIDLVLMSFLKAR